MINYCKVTLDSEVSMICKKCGSEHTKKNGSTYKREQKYQCNTCNYQFTENSINRNISEDTKDTIDKLLLERISLAGIVRVTGVSEKWLQMYINDKYSKIHRKIELNPGAPTNGSLVLQCDELWSFVGNKHNKQWVWLALDKYSRKIVGCYIGLRGKEGAQGLWDSLPPVYQETALCYTDFWLAYEAIFPAEQHRAVGKETGKTNYIERFNNTLRQRVSRLVRGTLSFPKKLENHIGAIWNFIHHYNDAIEPLFAK